MRRKSQSSCPASCGTKVNSPHFDFINPSILVSHIVHYTHLINEPPSTSLVASPRSQTEIVVVPDLCHQRLSIYTQPLPSLSQGADTVYMTLHLLPPVGSPGFCDFSISAIICSNAFPTFLFNRALASVKLQLNSSANFLPSSAWTWRWSAFRSLLFPTMTKGTQSAPCQQVRQMYESGGGFGYECLPGD